MHFDLTNLTLWVKNQYVYDINGTMNILEPQMSNLSCYFNFMDFHTSMFLVKWLLQKWQNKFLCSFIFLSHCNV